MSVETLVYLSSFVGKIEFLATCFLVVSVLLMMVLCMLHYLEGVDSKHIYQIKHAIKGVSLVLFISFVACIVVPSKETVDDMIKVKQFHTC